ncbi:MAG: hypothetical protein DHS20C02_16190 [Micavibrio sp.]|nr:MAG: hypothetical protein DHS20C02_16190 [Micavibrio sp.]
MNKEKPSVTAIQDSTSSAIIKFLPGHNEAVVTGQTYFGRDPDMHKALIDYFDRKKSIAVPEPGYHIFFPASSVGCEPFYFAMLAEEKGLLKDGFLTVHASDLQQEFIKYAKVGEYPKGVIRYLEDRLHQHFTPVANGSRVHDNVQLLEHIIQSVKFEHHGDIRNHDPEQLYDAVVLTHVIYHDQISPPAKEKILHAAMKLSKNLVLTDCLSFSENKKLYERVLMEAGFGVADENLDYKPLGIKPPHTKLEQITKALNPWHKSKPDTDIEGCQKASAFVAAKAPVEPSLR